MRLRERECGRRLTPWMCLPLGFDHWSEESMHHHAELVLQHLPDHPDPLKALVVRVDNKGPYPVRDIVLATTNFRPAVASMNGEDPEVRVRPLPSDLVPIKSKKWALFVFPDIEACAESDKLAVWFTDDEDRRWRKDVHGVTRRA